MSHHVTRIDPRTLEVDRWVTIRADSIVKSLIEGDTEPEW
jgi:hypothetical protein